MDIREEFFDGFLTGNLTGYFLTVNRLSGRIDKHSGKMYDKQLGTKTINSVQCREK